MRRTTLLFVTAFSACGVSTLELGGTEQGVLASEGMKSFDAGVPSTGGGVGSTGGGAAATGGGLATGGGVASGGGGGSSTGGGVGSEPDAGPPPDCEPGMTAPCTTSCGSTGTKSCVNTTWGACVPPGERCGNGVDDDCDGRSDSSDPECPPTISTCESEDGNGCNGDLGYGDHCAPSDNTNGCSPERFNAWCNRRNPEFPDIWHSYVRGWVDDRCDGTVAETGTQYSTWFCLSSENIEYRCTTPLVLSFDGAPVRYTRSLTPFAFTPGEPVASDWPASVTPWLVRDVNHDGRIDDGSELFGSSTRTPSGVARHGFEALAALDENHDGVVDAKDSSFSELRAWRDLDGDRAAQPGELSTLADEGVTSLSTRFVVEPRCDAHGNCERERGTFTTRTGRGTVIDVYLRTERAPTPVACVGPTPL